MSYPEPKGVIESDVEEVLWHVVDMLEEARQQGGNMGWSIRDWAFDAEEEKLSIHAVYRLPLVGDEIQIQFGPIE